MGWMPRVASSLGDALARGRHPCHTHLQHSKSRAPVLFRRGLPDLRCHTDGRNEGGERLTCISSPPPLRIFHIMLCPWQKPTPHPAAAWLEIIGRELDGGYGTRAARAPPIPRCSFAMHRLVLYNDRPFPVSGRTLQRQLRSDTPFPHIATLYRSEERTTIRDTNCNESGAHTSCHSCCATCPL